MSDLGTKILKEALSLPPDERAWAEFTDAVEYYNAQGEGLGFEFSEEIRTAIEKIIRYPEACTLISERTRRCRTKLFPME